MSEESICSICGKPEEITGTDGAGELTYKPHKHDATISINLPAEDIIKTLNMLAAVYQEKPPAEILALLPTVICNQLYAYRREMIANYKRGDKKMGKELEQWL